MKITDGMTNKIRLYGNLRNPDMLLEKINNRTDVINRKKDRSFNENLI
jgi:hypothetical protein